MTAVAGIADAELGDDAAAGRIVSNVVAVVVVVWVGRSCRWFLVCVVAIWRWFPPAFPAASRSGFARSCTGICTAG